MRWREQSIAPPLSGEARTFRVTHPFHPFRGRAFQLVDCRQTWGEDRVYFHDDSGQLAELSPRTFCTFQRELSSRRSTLPIVLEELSGVRERPMIMSMPTTPRTQQRYD